MLFLTDEINPAEHRQQQQQQSHNTSAQRTRRRSHMSAATTPAIPALAMPNAAAAGPSSPTLGGLLSVHSSERLRRLSSQERSLIPDWRRNSSAVNDPGSPVSPMQPTTSSSSIQRHVSDNTLSVDQTPPRRRASSTASGPSSPQVVVLIPPSTGFRAFAVADDGDANSRLASSSRRSSASNGPPRRRHSVVGFATPINEGLVSKTPDGALLVVPDDHEGDDEDAGFDADQIPSSLFLFSGHNPVRIACLHVIQNWWFHQFILACIVVNSIFLALDQPAVTNPQGLVVTQSILEWLFTIIFFLEMTMKIIALGFVLHPHSYLRVPWNCFDCLIVVASVINLFATSGNLSSLRVVRVLRPLRSVSRIKNLKLLIAGLFEALPAVANTLLLYAFVLMIFAIALSQLWQSQLSNRCYITGFDPAANSSLVKYTNATFGPFVKFPLLDQQDTNVCGSSVHQCQNSLASFGLLETCDIHRDIYTKPNLNYDSFPSALLLVLKVTVFDNWHNDMDDATRFAGYVAVPIFLLLTVVGGYVCVNLFLAVLTDGYSDAARKMKAEEQHAMVDSACQTTFTHITRHDDDGVHALLQHLSAKVKRTATSPRLMSQRQMSMRTHTSSDSSPPPSLTAGSMIQRIDVQSPTQGGNSSGDFGDFGTKVDVVIGELQHIDEELEDMDVDDLDSNTGSFASFRRTFGDGDDVDDRCAPRKVVGRVVSHKFVEVCVLLVTLLNVVALAIDHYGIDQTTSDALDQISFYCTIFFAAEITAKLFAYGPTCLTNGFNALDFLLVVIGIVTIAVNGSGGSAFAAFRALRVFRVFRFLKSFESLQTVVESILQSVVSIGYLSILILLFLYIYAILGMQIFGLAYTPSSAPDSFGTVWQSAITAFIVVTGDNWTNKMQVAMSNYSSVGLLVPALYFVTLNLVGNFILINLSIAIIVDKLQEKMDAIDAKANAEIHPPTLLLPPYNVSIMARKQQAEAQHLEKEKAMSGTLTGGAGPRQSFRRSLRVPKLSEIIAPKTTDDLARANAELDTFIQAGPAASTDTAPSSPREEVSPRGDSSAFTKTTSSSRLFDVRFSKYADHIEADENTVEFRLTMLSKYVKTFFISVPPVVGDERSFFVFAPDNPVRAACLWLVGLPAFHVVILVALATNVIFLCLDSPKASAETQTAINQSDYFFASLFCVEAIVKLIAFGAFFPAPLPLEEMQGIRAEERPVEAYFRDTWNCVDFFVTLVSVVGIFVSVVRPLRALRTIRLVARVETTRIILVALMQAIPHVLHGLLLSGIVFLVFGILGVQLFKGLFYQCNDGSIMSRDACIGNYTATAQGPVGTYNVTAARQWQRTFYHFDDLGASLLSLFVVSVGDNWSLIMYNGMSVTDNVRGLQNQASPWMALYFIAMYIAGNFFSINMMVGILINYFKRKKKEQDGSAFLTAKQRLYLKAREIMVDVVSMEDEVKLLHPTFSPWVHFLLTYKHPRVQQIGVFDAVMLLVILLNTACVASEADNMDSTTADVLNGIELACLCVFTVEMVMKWAAYGMYYFTNNWNRFDCIIVTLGWIAVGLPQVTFLGFLRVFRVVKLIRGSGVERLVLRLWYSVRSLLHVVAILILTYFIFAVAGVELFGDITPTDSLDDLNNFQTVWNAMLVLYYSGTTDNWETVLQDLSVQPPNCDPNVSGACGNSTVAALYMLGFMICCTFIALQLFVAVIVEIFSDDDDEVDPIKNAFLELRVIWIACYGDKAHTVHYLDLVQYAPAFPSVLTGFVEGEEVTRADMIRFLASLSLPVDSRHYIKYRDLVNSLALKLYQVDPRTMGNVVGDVVSSLFIGTSFSAAQVYALDVIADIWKQYQGDTTKVGLRRRRPSDHSASTENSVIIEDSEEHAPQPPDEVLPVAAASASAASSSSAPPSPLRKRNTVQFSVALGGNLRSNTQDDDDDIGEADDGSSDFVKSSSPKAMEARPSTAGAPVILVEDMDD